MNKQQMKRAVISGFMLLGLAGSPNYAKGPRSMFGFESSKPDTETIRKSPEIIVPVKIDSATLRLAEAAFLSEVAKIRMKNSLSKWPEDTLIASIVKSRHLCEEVTDENRKRLSIAPRRDSLLSFFAQSYASEFDTLPRDSLSHSLHGDVNQERISNIAYRYDGGASELIYSNVMTMSDEKSLNADIVDMARESAYKLAIAYNTGHAQALLKMAGRDFGGGFGISVSKTYTADGHFIDFNFVGVYIYGERFGPKLPKWKKRL